MINRLRLFCLALLLVIAGGCTANQQSNAAKVIASDKVNIVVSFYALEDFCQQIGGEHVSVTNLLSSGADPHDFEPSIKDRATIEKADLLVVNGLGMEHWLEGIVNSFGQQGPKVVVTTASINQNELIDGDVHVWLDPKLASRQVQVITEALIELDPLHKEVYISNQDKYIKKLSALDVKITKELANASKPLILNHGAFGYFSMSYGLEQVAILGLGVDTEPTPKRLAEIISYCRDNNIRYIYTEQFEHTKVAETVARELNATTLSLHTLTQLSDEEITKGYLEIMNSNLSRIIKGQGE